MSGEKLARIDGDSGLREKLLPCCRLKAGQIWEDPLYRHRVGCLDAVDPDAVIELCGSQKVRLSLHDPPYNFAVGSVLSDQLGSCSSESFIRWCSGWIRSSLSVMADNASLYVWLGADQRRGFQPLPEFMILMREFPQLISRSFITMRNQRGYGTQKNWMSVRQELLYYTLGEPVFNTDAVYTEIPRLLKGYYKELRGQLLENSERGKSSNIRAGNVWVDIQQVFYRMEENVPGCYAQKPLKAIERIVAASAGDGPVLDLFAHAGTTLLASERASVPCFTADIDPIFAEITIRRLEWFRKTGKTGWQKESPFPELAGLKM